jgi:hypothetical protein
MPGPVRLSDVIVPEVFFPYMLQKTKERAAIFTSGILNDDSRLSAFLAGGGRTANNPFWKDLSDTESDVGNDDPASLSVPEKITTGKDIVVRQVRTKSWSTANLVADLAGADPMQAVADSVAAYWERQFNAILVATLHGVYLDNVTNDAGDMVNDIGTDAVGAPTAAELVSAEAIIDSKQTMGDAAEDLKAIIMHSVVYSRLQKQNLIDFIPDSRGEINFPTYLGYRVIVSDTAKKITGTNRTEYVTYLVGAGALAWHEASLKTSPMIEVEREALQGGGMGVDILVSRRQFVLHPNGIKWTDTACAGEFPTNTELAAVSNWDRVYAERKQIPIAFLVTNG